MHEGNYSPQNMLDTELVHLLSKMNELQLSDKVYNSTTKRNGLVPALNGSWSK
jgi:hypothetical protein